MKTGKTIVVVSSGRTLQAVVTNHLSDLKKKDIEPSLSINLTVFYPQVKIVFLIWKRHWTWFINKKSHVDLFCITSGEGQQEHRSGRRWCRWRGAGRRGCGREPWQDSDLSALTHRTLGIPQDHQGVPDSRGWKAQGSQGQPGPW